MYCVVFSIIVYQLPFYYSLPNLNIDFWWDRIQYSHGSNTANFVKAFYMLANSRRHGSVGPMGILDSAPPGIYVKIWKTIVKGMHGLGQFERGLQNSIFFFVCTLYHSACRHVWALMYGQPVKHTIEV